jgi:MFS family permease
MLSHMHVMTVPSLLPLLPASISVDFVELGLAVSLFNISSALMEIPMGFASDRFGARLMLYFALILGSSGMLLFALMPGYACLLCISILCGVANGIYHPGDYTILSLSIRRSALGRAFSLHSFFGFLGSAITPGLLTAIAVYGGIRSAFVTSGMLGLLVFLLFLASCPSSQEKIDLLRKQEKSTQKNTDKRTAGIFSIPILVLVLVFMLLSLSNMPMEKFSVSTLIRGYNVDLTMANAALTAFLFCSAFGVLSGGFLADKTQRHGFVAAAAYLTAAFVVAVVALASLSDLIRIVLFGLIGFLMGVIVPSRDMLVRAAAPKGSEGKVFGVVFTGYNIGNAIGPVLFGYLLDNAQYTIIFVCAFVFILFTVIATTCQELMLAKKNNLQ